MDLEVLSWLSSSDTLEELLPVLRAVGVAIAGLLFAWLLGIWLGRSKRMSAQLLMVLRRVLIVTVLGVALITALRELGFDLAAVLGAAGIATVAVGFAAQTSLANIISGVFLIGERPFVLGDIIQVGKTTGEVLSIDLMSVKIRSYDNVLVRIPNETVLKAEVRNLTHFPIRRLDVLLPVAYDADLGIVRGVLDEVAAADPHCLDEPAPLFMLRGFGESALELQFSVWTETKRFMAFRTKMVGSMVAALRERGIAVPVPKRSVQLLTAGEGEPLSGDDDPGSLPEAG